MENKSLQFSLVGNQIIQLSITADQGQILLKKEHLRRKKLFLSCLDHTWLFFVFVCLLVLKEQVPKQPLYWYMHQLWYMKNVFVGRGFKGQNSSHSVLCKIQNYYRDLSNHWIKFPSEHHRKCHLYPFTLVAD